MKANIAKDIEGLAVPIEKLTRMPGNPRRGDVEAVIRSYTRFGQLKPIVATGNAEDGVLVDVTETAKEAGFKIPVVVTQRVWEECVAVPEGKDYQDEAGRLWDVLMLARFAASRSLRSDRVDYRLGVVTSQGCRIKTLTLDVGPGDTADPVMTIMFPGED